MHHSCVCAHGPRGACAVVTPSAAALPGLGVLRSWWIIVTHAYSCAQISLHAVLSENEALRERIAELEAQLANQTLNDGPSVVIQPLVRDSVTEDMSLASMIAQSQTSVVYYLPLLTPKVSNRFAVRRSPLIFLRIPPPSPPCCCIVLAATLLHRHLQPPGQSLLQTQERVREKPTASYVFCSARDFTRVCPPLRRAPACLQPAFSDH